MQSPQHYRGHAARARKLAEGVSNPALRQQLQTVAQDYDQMAATAERTSDSKDDGSPERDLAQAERHVRLGEQHLALQRQLIAELERDGHDTVQAKAILRAFEETQALHIQHRDRLRRKLHEIPD